MIKSFNPLQMESAKLHIIENQTKIDCYYSLEKFCNYYLSNHFYIQSKSEVQQVLYDVLSDERVNKRLVIKAPRGSGKTTIIGLGYALWCLSGLRKRFLLFIKESDDKAKEVIEKIRNEIESNPILIKHFPFLEPMRGKRIKKLVEYSNHLIRFKSNSIVMAVGKGTALRGINKLGFRPDVIIYDDPQGKPERESQALRDKDKSNFDMEIRYLGGPRSTLDIILIGNMIHFDCLIEYVSKKPGWQVIEIDAVRSEDRKQTYWDAVYCYETTMLTKWEVDNWNKHGQDILVKDDKGIDHNCMEIRQPFYGTIFRGDEPYIIGLHDENPGSFDQEYRHRPLEAESMPLRKDLWKYYPWTQEIVGKFPYRIGALDLSMGKKGSDFQAIVILGATKENYYLIDASLTRINVAGNEKNEGTLVGLILSFIEAYGLRTFIVEDNGAQALFINSLKREIIENGLICAIRPFRSIGNKEERISGFLGLIVQRGSFYVRDDYQKVYGEFLRQFEQFPKGAHDDAPDVTNMAIMGLQRLKKGKK